MDLLNGTSVDVMSPHTHASASALASYSSYDSNEVIVVVVGTSNRAEDIDPCFRRGGRFEKELEVVLCGAEDRARY